MPPATSASDQTASSSAALVADRAARAAGVRIDPVVDSVGVETAQVVLDEVWGLRGGGSVLPDDLLRVFVLTGQYLVLARDLGSGEALAASAALLCEPIGAGLHSHVTGVLGPGLGRGLGYAVKLNQRAWALDRGLSEIEWTYDPLIRRNAHFNLTKLGAQPERYLPDFYGEMTDALNAGDLSDRLLVRWHIGDAGVAARVSDAPRPLFDRDALIRSGYRLVLAEDGAGPVTPHEIPTAGGRERGVLIGTPGDVEALRREDLELAIRWRKAQRAVFLQALDAGLKVRGFTKQGDYILGPALGQPIDDMLDQPTPEVS